MSMLIAIELVVAAVLFGAVWFLASRRMKGKVYEVGGEELAWGLVWK